MNSRLKHTGMDCASSPAPTPSTPAPSAATSDNAGLTVHALLIPTPGMSMDASHNTVADWLAQHTEINTLAFVDGDRPVGLIGRQKIHDLYLQPYFRDVFGRKPCIAHANTRPLMVDINTPLANLTEVLTSSDRQYLTDGFIITEEGRYRGVGTGEQLVRTVTETQTRHLQASNQQLTTAIEQLQHTQKQLVQSEKLASLGALVAGIAHELNTPIGNSLMAATTLLEKEKQFRAAMAQGLRRSDINEFLEQTQMGFSIVARNLERAATLITGFKQVAADQTSSQRRPFLLKELVEEILLTLQPTLRRTPYTVQAQVPETISMSSYPGPLGQVLTNLIQNAIVHAFDGRDHGQITIEAIEASPMVRLSVRDDGRGIPPESLSRVFDPFFTTRMGQGGTGLGLNIVHNTVTALLGGSINLESQVGQGTTFNMELPLDAPSRP